MLITLHSNGYEVAVNTMGAELKSFKDPSGKEYVWNSDPAFWMRSSPLLFPTIGNLRNGETTMKGQVYPLVKHGFCKDTEFEVKDLSDDTVTFLLHANEETLKSYNSGSGGTGRSIDQFCIKISGRSKKYPAACSVQH